MSKVELILTQDHILKVSGELQKESIQDALEKGNVFFNGVHQLKIDLSAVTSSDSAALSLLLHWLRRACEKKVALTFVNLPAKMQDLARVSSLDTVLPTHVEHHHEDDHGL